jgi:hypothetical protein
MKTRELWLDFETWLERNYNKNVSDLSWNSYVLFSKEYNNERLSTRNNETRDRERNSE